MSHSNHENEVDAMTLDPPGSIAVVGAGPLGIEAALYGRYLGYNVTLVEAVAIGQSMADQQEAPLPMLPDRCLSPLAISALRAQTYGAQGDDRVLPTTCGQWISEALVPLAESDLLRGRLRMPMRVTEITQIAIESDEQGEDPSDLPPDFRLTLGARDGQTDCIETEAVILAVGSSCNIQIPFEIPAPYFWRIGATSAGDAEHDLVNGLREIVVLFAELAGRTDLDLYRPRRV